VTVGHYVIAMKCSSRWVEGSGCARSRDDLGGSAHRGFGMMILYKKVRRRGDKS
jgi:hypothetical protein